MKYEKPRIVIVGSGSPGCNDGSAATVDNPGCDNGDIFADYFDCGNGGSPEDYCMDGGAPDSNFCIVGTSGDSSGTRCFAGGTPS